MTLGQRIQELRKGLNLSQEELGERMGVSRQAISKWEGDQTIPELDKLIALSKLFGLTVGQLLGVEQPTPAAVPGASKRTKALLAGMGAAILILAILVGTLWSQVLALSRQAVLDEDYVSCYDRELFQTAECTLSDIELGFPQAKGTQDLTLAFTLEPVRLLKDWEVIGLTARIEGRNPWTLHPDGTPVSREEREWYRVENIPVSRGTASLTLPKYGGETVYVTATLREKGTGRTIDTVSSVFTVTGEAKFTGGLTIDAIPVEANPAPQALLPKSIARALPDPRFDG